MKKNRIGMFIYGLCAAALLITGCGGGAAASSAAQTTAAPAATAQQTAAAAETPAAGTKTSEAAETSAADAAGTTAAAGAAEEGKGREVTDSLGRTVVIPEAPERILALNSQSMEALFNLGFTPVGKIENYKIREEGMNLPSVGTASEINIEAVCQLEPDLIFAHSRFHSGHIEELELSGAVVYCFDPDNIDSTLTMYLGKVLGKEKEAAEYDAEYEKLCEQLKEEVQGAEEIRTGIVIQNGDTIKAAQTASGYGALLKGLGIENIVPDDLPNASKASFLDFDLETIITSDPDLILIVSAGEGGGQGAGKGQGKGEGKGEGQGQGKGEGKGQGKGEGKGQGKGEGKGQGQEDNTAALKKYTEDPQWAGMRAVQNGRLIVLPASINPNRSTQSDMIRITADYILKAIGK